MFQYYDPADAPFVAGDDPVFVAAVPAGIRDERELLTEVGSALSFPWYYGRNFDAFWDCVRDLDGIGARRVALVHRDLPALPADRLAIYIELLRDATLYWEKPSAAHRLEVWFPRPCEAEVNARLETCPPPADID